MNRTTPMIDPIRRLFTKPTAADIARRQLAELKRRELDYHLMLEEITAALDRTQAGIKRLNEYVINNPA